MTVPPVSGMAGIRAVLFDKDGTLLDYERSWGAVNRAAADLAAPGDPALACRLLAIGGADPSGGNVVADSLLAAASTEEIADAWVAAGAPHDRTVLRDRLDALFQRSVETVVPVTDLAALFRRLKAHGLKLGIVSSDSDAAVRATVARFGLAGLVDFVAGYDSGFGQKPSAGLVTAFCAAVDVPPRATAVVGDNTGDMAMAAAAGVARRIGVLTGTGTRGSLADAADFCLDSIADLTALMEF